MKLTEKQVAEIVGVDPVTIRRWRTAEKIGPPYLNLRKGHGKALIRYDLTDLNKWLEKSKVQTG